jgi:ABC-type multidrug transport system permease subunit
MWLIIYGFCGFVADTRSILLSMLCQALVTLVSIQGVIVACYIMPNQDLAMLLAVTNLTFTTLLAGFVVRVTDLTPVLQWISYVTPIRYAYQIMAILQFKVRPSSGAHHCMHGVSNASLM